MTSLATRLRGAGRKILAPYVTGGVTAGWTDYLLASQAAGADAFEIGLPFSDPTLDGAVIQRASDRALTRGARTTSILADIAAVRAAVSVPLIAMTYANLVVRKGSAAFCASLAEAGFSGLIVPDLPVDEAGELTGVAAAHGLDLVLLAAPPTPPDRLRRIAETSRGFVYAVSVMGTTGERAQLAESGYTLVANVKRHTDLPVLLGFGIAGAEHAARAARYADGVAVGAAVMRRVLDGASPEEVGAFVGEVRAGLDGG